MRPRLPALKAKEVVSALERAGFFVHHTSGSHAQLKHPSNPRLRVTVPKHSRPVPTGTLRSIIRQAGLTVEEFLDLL